MPPPVALTSSMAAWMPVMSAVKRTPSITRMPSKELKTERGFFGKACVEAGKDSKKQDRMNTTVFLLIVSYVEILGEIVASGNRASGLIGKSTNGLRSTFSGLESCPRGQFLGSKSCLLKELTTYPPKNISASAGGLDLPGARGGWLVGSNNVVCTNRTGFEIFFSHFTLIGEKCIPRANQQAPTPGSSYGTRGPRSSGRKAVLLLVKACQISARS